MSTLCRALSVRSCGFGVVSTAFLSYRRHYSHSEPIRMTSTIQKNIANPLKKKDYVPLFNEIGPNDVLPAIEDDLTNLSSDFKGWLLNILLYLWHFYIFIVQYIHVTLHKS
jgi:hypothetical protein